MSKVAAVLERTGNSLNWTHVLLPFAAVKAWGARGVFRVKGEKEEFRLNKSSSTERN